MAAGDWSLVVFCFFVCRPLALYTLHEPACFMRKWLIFFGPVCRKSLFVKKIKFFIFLVNSKIVQTEFVLSGLRQSGNILTTEIHGLALVWNHELTLISTNVKDFDRKKQDRKLATEKRRYTEIRAMVVRGTTFGQQQTNLL